MHTHPTQTDKLKLLISKKGFVNRLKHLATSTLIVNSSNKAFE